MRISDWSSDVCSSDLGDARGRRGAGVEGEARRRGDRARARGGGGGAGGPRRAPRAQSRLCPGPQRLAEGGPGRASGGRRRRAERKSVVAGKGGSVRVDLGGRRTHKKKKTRVSK